METTAKLNIRIERDHSLKEWQERFGGEESLWDFDPIELLDGSIEPDRDMVYWLIDGRLYETR